MRPPPPPPHASAPPTGIMMFLGRTCTNAHDFYDKSTLRGFASNSDLLLRHCTYITNRNKEFARIIQFARQYYYLSSPVTTKGTCGWVMACKWQIALPLNKQRLLFICSLLLDLFPYFGRRLVVRILKRHIIISHIISLRQNILPHYNNVLYNNRYIGSCTAMEKGKNVNRTNTVCCVLVTRHQRDWQRKFCFHPSKMIFVWVWVCVSVYWIGNFARHSHSDLQFAITSARLLLHWRGHEAPQYMYKYKWRRRNKQ